MSYVSIITAKPHTLTHAHTHVCVCWSVIYNCQTVGAFGNNRLTLLIQFAAICCLCIFFLMKTVTQCKQSSLAIYTPYKYKAGIILLYYIMEECMRVHDTVSMTEYCMLEKHTNTVIHAQCDKYTQTHSEKGEHTIARKVPMRQRDFTAFCLQIISNKLKHTMVTYTIIYLTCNSTIIISSL